MQRLWTPILFFDELLDVLVVTGADCRRLPVGVESRNDVLFALSKLVTFQRLQRSLVTSEYAYQEPFFLGPRLYIQPHHLIACSELSKTYLTRYVLPEKRTSFGPD